MIWALKNKEKVRAIPNQKAFCPICNEELISKCGDIKIWHWSHKSGSECDDFYEPESYWHISWKNEFPKEQQEVAIKKRGEYHIADIKTKTGLVIELQNSPISKKEIEEREEFYENMIWLINGLTLGINIEFKSKIIQWKWSPSILKFSSKPLFINLYGDEIIKINSYWKFRQRVYCDYTHYPKKIFLQLYGDIVK